MGYYLFKTGANYTDISTGNDVRYSTVQTQIPLFPAQRHRSDDRGANCSGFSHRHMLSAGQPTLPVSVKNNDLKLTHSGYGATGTHGTRPAKPQYAERLAVLPWQVNHSSTEDRQLNEILAAGKQLYQAAQRVRCRVQRQEALPMVQKQLYSRGLGWCVVMVFSVVAHWARYCLAGRDMCPCSLVDNGADLLWHQAQDNQEQTQVYQSPQVPRRSHAFHQRRYSRHIDFPKATSIPKKRSAGVTKRSLKKCYTYFGKGRGGYQREIPCAQPEEYHQKVSRQSLRVPWRYSYTGVQPEKCLTDRIKERCKIAHADVKKSHKDTIATQMVLKIDSFTCLCPPPEGARVTIVPPHPLQPSLDKTHTKPSTRHLFASVITAAPGTHDATAQPLMPITGMAAGKTPAENIWPGVRKKLIFSPRFDVGYQPRLSIARNISPTDDVKIEKMYDFSCIDERSDMSSIDIVRQIGRTLSNPLKQLGTESQIIHHHNIQGRGCPPHRQSQNLADMLDKAGSILVQVLTLLPHSQPLAVLQLIVGPALEVFSDGLEGKPLDLQKIEGIDQQIMFMTKQIIKTYSADEISILYDKSKADKDITGPLSRSFNNRKFSYKDKRIGINVKGNEYPLQKDINGNPFVLQGGTEQIVFFNTRSGVWDFAGPKVKDSRSITEQEIKKIYGKPLGEFLENSKYDLIIDESDSQILIFSKASGESFKAVMMEGFIVPVEQIKAGPNGNKKLTLTAAKDSARRKVLLLRESGWMFEEESAKVDDNLAIILNIKRDEITYSADKVLSVIQDDGLCYDAQGHSYLKFKDRYHAIHWIANDKYVLDSSVDTFIEQKDNSFTLVSAYDVIFSQQTVSVGVESLESVSHLAIESEAYQYLTSQGKRIDTIPVAQIGPGIYIDAVHRKIFSANGLFFEVSHYDGNGLDIECDQFEANQPAISLYLLNDVFYRVRDNYEYSPENYSEIVNCHNRRAVESSSTGCIPIFMTKELDSLFKKNIARNVISRKNILNKSVISYDDNKFPQLYISTETGNLYFLHDGHYFNAEWVSEGDRNNPLGIPVLRLFIKNFAFRLKKEIALIVSEKNQLKFEIKTVRDYLSEKLHIKNEFSKKLIFMLKYKHVSDFKTISSAVNEVILSKKFYLSKMTRFYSPEISESQIHSLVVNKLYPNSVINAASNRVVFFKLNMINEHHPLYLRKGSQEIDEYINFIKDNIIPETIYNLENINADYETYLSSILKTNNIDFLVQFASALRKRLITITNNLNADSIYLTDLIKNPIAGYHSPAHKEVLYYEPILTPEQRGRGNVAIALTDRSKRIFINLDKLYYVDPTHPDVTLRKKTATDVITTLLHEASHIGGITTDIVYFPRENGEIIPVLSSIDDMVQKIAEGRIINKQDFNKLNQDYFTSISVYRSLKKSVFENAQLAYIAENDPGYLAHLLLNTADGIAQITRDLYKLAFTRQMINIEISR
ncbi:hypothetical protein [Biostraticola tofi]|uniref:Uncharacterized protein n=1 Tax=Biostraticola tofi TaxID=466109 RepID=A0A4R3YV44_9GAMM|nr:hypothetical protein [Biostraticola tofi]TCV95244.1 hypothetical protein EDC52_106175 [Biostraticola tofi]